MATNPELRFHVAEPGRRTQKGWERVTLGRDIKVDFAAIQKTFPTVLEDSDSDLLTVIAAVLFVDRSARRTLSGGWARNLNLLVPVFSLDLWTSARVTPALQECLRYLTGDRWRFEFYSRNTRPAIQQDLLADRSAFEGLSAVIPYSGGLDSLAGLEVLRAQSAENAVLLVGSESSRDIGRVIRRTTSSWIDARTRVSVKIHLHPWGRPETTYRTRTFGYFSTTALAAKLVGGTEVRIMENGQGALGPSLLPSHREFPYRASHPGFTSRLHAFLTALQGYEKIFFNPPHVWQTKAELLRNAARTGDPERWKTSVSCSYNIQRQRGKESAPLCGICGGCILRTVALWNAGFAHIENRSDFVFNNLDAGSLAAGMGGQVTSSESALGHASVLNMNYLARLSEKGASSLPIQRVADELSVSNGLSLKVATKRLSHLIDTHAQEWWDFIDQREAASWLAQVGGHRG